MNDCRVATVYLMSSAKAFKLLSVLISASGENVPSGLSK